MQFDIKGNSSKQVLGNLREKNFHIACFIGRNVSSSSRDPSREKKIDWVDTDSFFAWHVCDGISALFAPSSETLPANLVRIDRRSTEIEEGGKSMLHKRILLRPLMVDETKKRGSLKLGIPSIFSVCREKRK